jgi:DNA modification methylase
MDWSSKTKKEIVEYCKENKIKGYTGKSREDLIKMLSKEAEPSNGKGESINFNIDGSHMTFASGDGSTKTALTIGNCVDLLKTLGDESVRVFYLDPPFDSDRNYQLSSDNSLGFKDKWDGDDYEKFIKTVIDACFPKLMKDGTLFFHISADRMFIPEKILREKFKNVSPIFWKKCRSKNNVKNKLGATIDIIFKCSKTPTPLFNVVYQEKDATYLANSFKNKDARGNYALGHLVTETSKSNGYKYDVTINGRTFSPDAGWRICESELTKLIEEDRVHVPKGLHAKLYKKIYLEENPGKPCTDLWDDIHSIGQGSEERKYPTAKPIKLIERILAISSNPCDLVCDPMCGSGTTGNAAFNLGRNCVMFDQNPEVVDVVKSRF